MKKFLVILFLLNVLIGFSQNNIQYKIDSIIQHHKIPAVACGIVTKDSIKYEYYSGIKNGTTKNKITKDDYFHIGSNTKSITALLIKKLEKDGLLKLDNKISLYYKNIHPDYASKTIRDLLNHTAGVPPYTSGNDYTKLSKKIKNNRTLFSNYILKQPNIKDTLQPFIYSNAGYCISANIAEKVTKKSWEKLLHELLSEQLNIDYFLGFPIHKNKNYTTGYFTENDSLIEHTYNNKYKLFKIGQPAGDISMTLPNYLKMIQEFLLEFHNESKIIDSLAFNDLVLSGHKYDGGWLTFKNKEFNIIEHNGSAGIFFTNAILFLEKKYACVTFINTSNSEAAIAIRNELINHYKSMKK